jgi:hypothetical protein
MMIIKKLPFHRARIPSRVPKTVNARDSNALRVADPEYL